VPWSPIPIPVPVAHHDRPPETEWETSTFTYTEASKYDESWVGVDVPTAKRVLGGLLEAFQATRSPLLSS
jgi:hypothetical protein